MSEPSPASGGGPSQLVRGIGLPGAISLNVINMVGVGPFITLPLIVLAMHGPQAITAWILAAVLAACDGLVWAELGAAMPEAGGSYWYLRTIYGPDRAGRLISFLYIWQLTFSAPLSIASGCVGLAQYAGYLFPQLRRVYFAYQLPLPLPLAGTFHLAILLGPATLLAMLCCCLAAFLLYRNIQSVARRAAWLWIGVMGTLLAVILTGLLHFHARQAFGFAPGSFAISKSFLTGLGAAMLIATYDYWGAYSIAFLGGEVRDPGRTIPRAILWSVALVAVLYLLLNTSVLGLIPWQELSAEKDARFSVAAVVMSRTYGPLAGKIIALLVIWTAFASVYALLLSYSRVPYAAAIDGNYFRAFARVHPRYRFPNVSLLVLAAVSLVFCMLQLIDLVAALVVIRILLQFLLQHVGVMVLRRTHPEMHRPFRIWLYPLPPLVAIAGFLYILFARPNFAREFFFAGAIVLTGTMIYVFRAYMRREWPFAGQRGQSRSG
ncbi:MAG TPA: APC family permease [Acidobacteriaceae bacterium]|nr:APC family permease [Acidobacteriaceae bacterium]